MKRRFVEVTNGPCNWGKFMVAQFDEEDWSYRSRVDEGTPLLSRRGLSRHHLLVVDLQTGEGALFRKGGVARIDLNNHRIWVCPMFEPFLKWLYEQPDPMAIPAHVDFPDEPGAFRGYRRPGPAT